MASEPPRLFVDTWGWLVLEDRKHPAHAEVEALRRRDVERNVTWATTDYVLDETVTRLFARRPFEEAERFCGAVFRARSSGLVLVESISPERCEKAYRLRLRYRDKPRISFTDWTSFVVMKELGIRQALTADDHFTQVNPGFQVVP